MARQRMRSAALLGSLVFLVALTVGGSPAGSATRAGPTACPSPHPAVLALDVYPGHQSFPDFGVPSSVPTPSAGSVVLGDSDGDGHDDVVNTDDREGVVAIHQAAGVVKFARAGATLAFNGWAGDLRGNGRESFAIAVVDSASDSTPVDDYLIPGPIGPGTYDPATVGIRIPVGGSTVSADQSGVGAEPDFDGDGHPDLEVVTTNDVTGIDGTTTLLSGAKVLAAGLQGDARTGATIRTFDAVASATIEVDLGAGPGPVLLLPHRLTSPAPDGGVTVDLADATGTRLVLTTEPHRFFSFIGAWDLRVTPTGTYLLAVSTDSREGSEGYVWRLDRPCGPLVLGSTTPTTSAPPASMGTAPPAVPIAQPASFTG